MLELSALSIELFYADMSTTKFMAVSMHQIRTHKIGREVTEIAHVLGD